MSGTRHRFRHGDLTLGGCVLLLAALTVFPPGGTPQAEGAGAPSTATAPAPDRPDARTSTRPRTRVEAKPMDDAKIDGILAVARDVDPDLADKLTRLRAERPDEFGVSIRNARHLLALEQIKRRDPVLYDMKVSELRVDAKIDRLLGELVEARESSSPSVVELEARLEQLVTEQVGLSLATRGRALLRLEQHVKELRGQLAEELGNFPKAVERRLEELLGEVEDQLGGSSTVSDTG